MDHVSFDREAPTNLATLVVAFGGWIDAGRAATGALRHLVRDLSATRVARIEAEEFFVFTQERPEVRLKPDGGREIHWPRSEFFAWRPEDGRDGLLLFCGPEPHQRWNAYTQAFIGVAERCGVKRIVSLGALLAGAPHTRPVRVTARCSDPASRPLLEAWGIYRPPTYEGPTGISTVVLDAAERRGIQHVGFMGQAPHYLPESENPAAIHALVTYVARLLNLRPDMSEFAEAIRVFRAQCDRAVARDRATREHVRQLEQEYDAEAGEGKDKDRLPDGDVDSDKLMQDVEDFLRRQREGGAGS
jgi:proteasome assembly chaperone (PAC2) family protein